MEHVEYLRVKDVAELLHLSPTTIYTMTASGELPHVRVGRSIRVAGPVLDEWLRQHETPRLEVSA